MKKETEEKVKTKKKPSKKKQEKTKEEGYFKQVRSEMKKVSWPSKKEVMKYTLATLVFCIIVGVFFLLLNFGLSFIKGMFV